MANENSEPDDGPAPDPFEAELVAYLDGELDAAAARKVEARLAADPAARARAAELKKSFDLLDYLPKPEPSPNFTTRTLDKLPAVKAGAGSAAQPTAAARPTEPKSKSQPVPAHRTAGGSVSTSMPIPLDGDEEPVTARRSRPKPLLWGAAVCAAVAMFAVVGYFATAALRPHLFPNRDKDDDAKVEVDPRVIENLPLYAAADDLAFVAELTKPEYFGDDPAVAYDPGLKIPAGDTADKPTGKQFDALAKAFRALPAARRAEIVKLDQELHAQEPHVRDRLFRALEAYAVWLERLPEPERRGVTGAATPGLRLAVVKSVRDKQWLDSLPPPLRSKPELIERWREDEALRHDRWAFVRQHAEAFAANKSPWPFDTEAGRKEVVDFARDVLKVDDPKKCRLSGEELAEYKRLYGLAQRDGAWAWYGLLVYELSRQHPYLPEPESIKMYVEPSELPEPYSRVLQKKGGGWRIKTSVYGKWPEFPLEVHRESQFLKFLAPNAPPLGPARPTEFKPAVRDFATKELIPKLTAEERRDLQRLEGRWPDYPQRLLHYAHKYDLPVPGVTLPGPPRRWDATYGTRPGGPPK